MKKLTQVCRNVRPEEQTTGKEKKGETIMKKLLVLLLTMTIMMLPVLSVAVDSRESKDIPEVEPVEVEPEDPEKEVIPPTVEIKEDPEEILEEQEDLKTIFHLTIYYIYEDGSTAAETYEAFLQAGTQYEVESPVIEGYETPQLVVKGKMPWRDVQFTVIYYSLKEESPVFPVPKMKRLVTMDEYETPLGLGFCASNLGLCFE